MKILVCGLPGSGKTTLALELVKRLGERVLHINADVARATINRDLSFTVNDRLENARRLGAIATMASRQGLYCVTDFVCPLPATYYAFSPDFTVWMGTIKEGRFADTNSIYERPANVDYAVTRFEEWGASQVVDEIISLIKATPAADKVPTFGELIEWRKDCYQNVKG